VLAQERRAGGLGLGDATELTESEHARRGPLLAELTALLAEEPEGLLRVARLERAVRLAEATRLGGQRIFPGDRGLRRGRGSRRDRLGAAAAPADDAAAEPAPTTAPAASVRINARFTRARSAGVGLSPSRPASRIDRALLPSLLPRLSPSLLT
jgi:hypothetical protein